MTRLGTSLDITTTATIRKFNGDGTVVIALNDVTLQGPKQEYTVSMPVAWTGPAGEFAGGRPGIGSTVSVIQGKGGKWYINSYQVNPGVFDANFNVPRSDAVPSLRDGEYLIQVKDGTKVSVDPKDGIKIGKPSSSLHLSTSQEIISHNFASEFSFTEAGRSVKGVIKRDLFENSNRNVLGSSLDSISYDKNLFTIGLDPSTSVSRATTSNSIRNIPLVENREIFYEFAKSYDYNSDDEEISKYQDPSFVPTSLIKDNRRENRTDTLSLNKDFNNYLIEVVHGTAVDIYGNILDLNRNILPIGKIDELSLRKSQDKVKTFTDIKEVFRKSIAYRFELNAKKDVAEINVDEGNYLRNKSNFSFEVDKEGQFKLNIPASSEIGNITLNTRPNNYSSLLAKSDSSVNPNQFLKNSENIDIYLENFAGNASINLSGSDDALDGYQSPLHFTLKEDEEEPIKYGTVYHDILKVCQEFQTSAKYLEAGLKLIKHDPNNRLNQSWVPLEKIVSDTIIVNGPDANAGGRSGTISSDGSFVFNIGANTIDRQSLWIDTAGGTVTSFGRDKGGISWAGGFDGDVLLQIGGVGIGNSFDTRFADQNDAYRPGTFEMRVLMNGQIAILRIGPEGITLSSPGTINLTSQQDIIIRSNSNLMFEAENIVMYSGTEKRIINRFPKNTIG